MICTEFMSESDWCLGDSNAQHLPLWVTVLSDEDMFYKFVVLMPNKSVKV